MTLNPLIAAGAALSGNFILSVSMILQKRYVSWFGYKGLKDSAYRQKRFGWVLGFTLMNLAPILNYIALLGLPPNVVGAASGTNVAFTAILATFMLGERLNAGKIFWTGVMFSMMVIAALRAYDGTTMTSLVLLYISFALLLILS